MSNETIILGVDPGSHVTGYGIIRSKENSWEPLDFGAIRPPSSAKKHDRYLVIFEAILHLIEKYQPEAIAVETQFVYKNVQSALKLGMACGSVLIATAKHKIPLFEYAPRKIKLAVVGRGAASKYQVQQMVQMQLKLPKPPQPLDAADALAIALCHAYNKDSLCLNTSAAN
jgi:crossover junction endodeoxyribonuclease RuvC